MQAPVLILDDTIVESEDPSLKTIKAGFDALHDHVKLSPKEQKAKLKAAKATLKEKHGITTGLLSANTKLTKSAGYTGTYASDKEVVEPVKDKKTGKGVESTGLALSPAHRIGKINTCPNSESCKSSCLGKTSGGYNIFGGTDDNLKGPRLAQRKKTEALASHPHEFAVVMHHEIEAAKKKAAKNDNILSVRKNVTSDIHSKVYDSLHKIHHDVQFYDYTKNMNDKATAPNHHFTYSSTGVSRSEAKDGAPAVDNPHQNWHHMRNKLESGNNVAMAFTSRKHLPTHVHDHETGKKYKVVDGDEHDYRPNDEKGVVVGLRTKGVSEEKSKKGGFAVHYDPKVHKDGIAHIEPQKRKSISIEQK
jgi:hypothetical protein